MPPGRLYVVSTPIGNLGDFSPRAVETLQHVALVLAEDTRHSRILLRHYGITTPVESHHEHNEASTTPALVERLRAGDDIALISDAGTPLLSDPGERLVRAAIAAGVTIVPIPGASALLAALVVSGFDTERFTFFGFLPRRGRARETAIAEIRALRHVAVVYEAPQRLVATLDELAEALGDERHIIAARELTKQFEDVRRGTAGEVARYYRDVPPKGEIVVVVDGARPAPLDEAALRERARALLAAGTSPRDVARTLIVEHGVPRNVAYRMAQDA
ncbi:MAG TPA: 16S rRNA (cytidine(1402)-2'-O)-methyltransferase [Gemmatimonadaceae bacterium]|nr:16S rRNA (cytidine(1402)-2'-O)-methyltransferase [Gemmatimonadaceae bacterium]